MLLVENPQRLSCDVPLLRRSDLASVDWLGAPKHGMLSRTDEVQSDAADVDLPLRMVIHLHLMVDFAQALLACPAMAPRLLVESVGIEDLEFVASPAAPSLDSFRMGCHHLRPRWRVMPVRLV